MRYSVFFLLLHLCCVASVLAGSNDKLVKLADDVYARIASPNGNAVGNSGFIILEHCVVVFDTHFTTEEGRQLLDAIRSVTSLPVRFVVNSHYHPDHTHGNQVFRNAQIIGSRETRRGILQNDLPSLERSIRVTTDQLAKMEKNVSGLKDSGEMDSLRNQIETREAYLNTLKQLKIIAPFVVMKDALFIEDGNLQVQILSAGPGHTENDTILFVPSKRIIFCGGLFFNFAVPNVQDAKILQWKDTLQHLLELDADLFVPGHGPPGNRQNVQAFMGYLDDLKNLVEPFVAGGKSLEQAMREIQLPEKYYNYRFKNLFPSNIQKMYEELKAQLLLSIPVEGPQLPAK